MIYIVEDEKNIREMIAMALISFSYDVRTFDNAEDAVELAQRNVPDLFVLDIMLPGMNGIEAVQVLRKMPKTKDIPILMLSAKNTELDKVAGFNYGADDYVTKPFSIMELCARIKALLRRSGKIQPLDVITVSEMQIDRSSREVTLANTPLALTYKEYELLTMLIREHKRVVPREELLNAIWGEDFYGESRTLDIHIRTLRQKLGDNADAPKYIKTYRSVGYRFIGHL